MQHHIGSSVIWLDQIDSTNNLAKQWLDSGDISDGMVICAHYQSAGRGQGDKNWESEPGQNLAFSLMLLPHSLPASEQIRLNITISLAIHDFISLHIPHACTIKWPNDIYVGNQKVSGILIENSIQGEHIKQSICGIGININQKEFYANSPTSLALNTDMQYDLEKCLNECLHCIQQRINQMYQTPLSVLIEQYESVMYRIGLWTEFLKDEMPFHGIVEGLHESGCLKIQTEQGTQLFRNKELIWLQ